VSLTPKTKGFLFIHTGFMIIDRATRLELAGEAGWISDSEGESNKMKKTGSIVVALFLCLILCYGVAAIGGFFTAGAIHDWYPKLAKPAWNPPSWVFGPVWTLLYGMMAIAVWLVWLRRRDKSITIPIVLFLVQLLFNAIWSPLFFGLHRLDIAFVDIVLLWLALAATVWLFLKCRRTAGVLLVPYLIWVSFAVALNFSIWQLNR
jgi:benzodiazapine receptor